MRTIDDYDEIAAMIAGYLRPGLMTNWASDTEVLRREAAAGTLLTHEYSGGLLLLRRRPGHFILNYYLSDPGARPDIALPCPTVLELPQRPGSQSDSSLWERMGFRPRLRRVRLSRAKRDTAAAALAVPDISAREARELLERCFDPLTGCLPGLEELEEDIARGRLISIDRRALLRFSSGPAASIRHLAVAEEFRHQGLGRQLMERFDAASGGRRALVWTGRDNAAAIGLYEKSGFQPDGWQSLVMIKDD